MIYNVLMGTLNPTHSLIHTPMARCSVIVLKVPFDTNKPTSLTWSDLRQNRLLSKQQQ